MMPADPSPARPSTDQARELLDRAKEARSRAYAPYSGFPVGAAILTGSGEIVVGCNVENAAYPLSLCAERVALVGALSRDPTKSDSTAGVEGADGAAGVEGAPALRAIAVVGPRDSASCWPCGSCRQALAEFSPEIWVISPSGEAKDAEGGLEMMRLSELLPRPFGPRTLGGGH